MAGPVGLSPTDIVQGIALATRICESHFVKARRAGKWKLSSLHIPKVASCQTRLANSGGPHLRLSIGVLYQTLLP